MCGLLGFLSNDRTAKEVRDDLAAALELAHHRGPDEGGTLHDEDTVLGFRRLSIIDLDNSHQPLPYDDGRYWLLFNGEIYNYVELRERLAREHGASFATDGDGEAILAAYQYLGEDCVRELRGMFAFLIWDTEERVLFGARDWFGIKPLFTMTDERGTFFGSEKKSLLELGGRAGAEELDTRSLQHYLTLQYVPEPATHAPADPPGREWHRVPAAPGRRAADLALLPAEFPDPGRRRRAAAATTRSARWSRTPSPSTCARTSPSARSCPAASTRPPSPRWRSGTTRS